MAEHGTFITVEDLEMEKQRAREQGFHEGYAQAMSEAQRSPRVMTLEEVLAWAEIPEEKCDPIFLEEKDGRSGWIALSFCPKDYYGFCLYGDARCWTSDQLKHRERQHPGMKGSGIEMTKDEINEYIKQRPYSDKSIDTIHSCDLEFHYRKICPSSECLCAKKFVLKKEVIQE